ncbi:predicted protein [Chaetomium globosum CBS 148.51]|uniref:Uncharacterized protein n=1 Tax=Chaetomium globosum (strain ATCC 6205 / CBS 148.51 / DSM 1962 / NBRC 6347 / NRRL 1970) TaxID=306901 RepID=Q2GQR3_CHAGB|nr:uncharacterized protein CHGG_09691 [Chaetomium globosum CBS 148.51]EAQ83287.1 predicted protein [Chaetomium globosum CBS 148.51]
MWEGEAPAKVRFGHDVIRDVGKAFLILHFVRGSCVPYLVLYRTLWRYNWGQPGIGWLIYSALLSTSDAEMETNGAVGYGASEAH